jgi:hypothetical protein
MPGITIMSMFNTDVICMGCKDKEERHPDYEAAREAESRAVRRGDYNHPGVGKPDNL